MKRILFILSLTLFFPFSAWSTDFTATNQLYGWNGSAQFYQTWTDHLAQLGLLYAPVLTSDQNYVSDAELVVVQATSGVNTGDDPNPEGTAIASTGEGGGIKFLREDGDGTSSWQTPAGGGNVSNSGTPTVGQTAVWVTATTIQGVDTVTAGAVGEAVLISETAAAAQQAMDTEVGVDVLGIGGGTLTGELVLDELGLEGQPTDTLTDCSTFAATGGGLFYDDSEGVWKKCQDNVLTVMDTTGGGTWLKDTLALNTAEIAANDCATLVTDTATGATTDSIISWSYASSPEAVTGHSAASMVSIQEFATTDTANFLVCNLTDTAVTPGAMSLNWELRL